MELKGVWLVEMIDCDPVQWSILEDLCDELFGPAYELMAGGSIYGSC
jgi:hypothetical protein